MQLTHYSFLLCAACFSSLVMANEPPPRPDNAAFEEAMEECASSSGGKMSALDACMADKGFEKPDGPPTNGKPLPEPPTAN